VLLAEIMMSPAHRGSKSSKDGVDGLVGDVHSSHDVNCGSRTNVHNPKKMKLEVHWVTLLVLRIISVARRIKLLD
jgi:hypothetical protein